MAQTNEKQNIFLSIRKKKTRNKCKRVYLEQFVKKKTSIYAGTKEILDFYKLNFTSDSMRGLVYLISEEEKGYAIQTLTLDYLALS